MPSLELTAFEAKVGRGVTGVIGGQRAALGNARLLEELGLTAGPLAAVAETLRAEGQTVVFVAEGDTVLGLIGVVDPIKETTAEALKALKAAGVRVVMLTGDSQTTAAAVAKQLGIDEVHAEVLPAQKEERGEGAPGRREDGGHGRRRHQRCAGPGEGPRGHRHGHAERTWP